MFPEKNSYQGVGFMCRGYLRQRKCEQTGQQHAGFFVLYRIFFLYRMFFYIQNVDICDSASANRLASSMLADFFFVYTECFVFRLCRMFIFATARGAPAACCLLFNVFFFVKHFFICDSASAIYLYVYI